MAPGQVYPKKKQNRVNRYKENEDYSLDTIKSIMDCMVHVGFIDDGAPIVLPMIGKMAQYDDNPMAMYIHGYVSGRLMRCMKSKDENDHPKVCVTGSRGSTPEISINMELVDGLVLTFTPYSHNYNYRSAMLHGTASFLEDDEEQMFAMEQITNHVHPNRWTDSRTPPTKTELTSTGIMRVDITSASAKIRTGPPQDADKDDWENMEMRNRVWVGIVPVYETLGEPITGEYSLLKSATAATEGYIKKRNAKEKGWSELVANQKLDLPLQHPNGA